MDYIVTKQEREIIMTALVCIVENRAINQGDIPTKLGAAKLLERMEIACLYVPLPRKE